MKKYINIHLEAMDDNGEKLKRILDEDIPCAISICPETLRTEGIYGHRENYSKLFKFSDLIGALVNKPGNILGQQGNIHKCKHKHRFADPWHENSCLYHGSLSKQEQRDLMAKGRETLRNLLGKDPEIYVSPNHQDDFTTMDVACERHLIFAIRGLKVLRPLLYKKDLASSKNLLVVPEAKLGERGYFHYVHYDQIGKNQKVFDELVKDVGSYHDIGIAFGMNRIYFPGYKLDIEQLTDDRKLIRRNRRAVNKRKLWRDIKRNIPGLK
jgi:hypothetical protein